MCDKEGKSIENFSNKLEEVLMEKHFQNQGSLSFMMLQTRQMTKHSYSS